MEKKNLYEEMCDVLSEKLNLVDDDNDDVVDNIIDYVIKAHIFDYDYTELEFNDIFSSKDKIKTFIASNPEFVDNKSGDINVIKFKELDKILFDVINEHKHVIFTKEDLDVINDNKTKIKNFFIKYIKNDISQLTDSQAIRLLDMILNNKIKIHITDIKKKYKKCLQYNKSKFNDDLFIKENTLNVLKSKIYIILHKIKKDKELFYLIQNFGNLKITFDISSKNFVSLVHDEYANEIIQRHLPYITGHGSKQLLELILRNKTKIHVKDFKKDYNRFLRYNKKKFTQNCYLKKSFLFNLQVEIFYALNSAYGDEIFNENILYENKDDDDNKTNKSLKIKLNNFSLYRGVLSTIYKYGKKTSFYYDFDENNDDETKNMTSAPLDMLHKDNIHITSEGIEFNYPLEFEYRCPRCGGKSVRSPLDVECDDGKNECPNYYTYTTANGEEKTKLCKKKLKPSRNFAVIKPCYFYNISYKNRNGDLVPGRAISFNLYRPGYYNSVFFKIKEANSTVFFHIMDVQESKNNKFKLPEQKQDENYIFTLQKEIDRYICEQTGLKIFGLYPIKVCFILQALASALGKELHYNIQLVGDASTGKSMILKYYGYCLYNSMYKSTDGVSISVPALRGTRTKLQYFGTEISIVTIGYLGTYKGIHIDEARENKNLIEQLKSFLYKTNYGYDKAGATGISHTRTAHINLSENLDYDYVGQYRGAIRKEYKNINIKFLDKEKPKWNEDWDLYKPLYEYFDNPYLYHVIKQKRQEYKKKKIFWIDGYDYALHERFPFYFYLVSSKEKVKGLMDAVKHNVVHDIVTEDMKLISVLKTKDLTKFFNSLNEYKIKDDKEVLYQIDKILDEYGIEYDSRTQRYYYNIVIFSRIINRRKTVNEQDFHLLKWIIETTNRKIYVKDTATYDIRGAPDFEEIQIEDKKIEEEIDKLDINGALSDNIDLTFIDGDID